MNKHNFSLISPTYWPAWAGLSLLWLITRLPYRLQFKIGKILGKILYLFPSRMKDITKINIKLCFPELTPAEQTALIKENFSSLGLGFIETAIGWWVPDNKLTIPYQIHGLHNLTAASAQKKGIILLSPHFTCLEIIARLISSHYYFAAMYTPHKNKFIAFLHDNFRKKKSIHFIPRHQLRELLRALNSNMAVWYAYDVDGGRKRSVFAPFFGINTASLTAASRLATLSGAAIVPISFYRRTKNFGYDIYLMPALDNFPSNNLITDATRLNAILEDAIRKEPAQYIWQYKRFKTRPNGEKRFY